MTEHSQTELATSLEQTLYCHRHALRRALRRLGSNMQTSAADWQRLEQRVAESMALAQRRQAALPPIRYAQELPVAQRKDEIATAIAKHQVVVIAGETGSGKTTQLPKICLEIGRGIFGRIGHTQPRRLAARTVAARIAEELGVPLGAQVGYQVRFSDQVGDESLIKLMTDGILLAEIQQDPFLNQYDTLIIDEAHERSLNIDFLLGYIKQLLPRRPELKLVITSATIDLERIARHFDDAPIIQVTGRTYPVEVQYQPLAEDVETREEGMTAAVVAAIESIRALPVKSVVGDILVFLSGEREIREVTRELKQRNLRHTEVLPLYARLSAAEQARVFQPHSGQRILLATNVAETSLTVPGIHYVVDSGLARISRYSVRSKIQRLPIEPISRASAEQRKGRCGRIAPGLCIRLYSEQDYLARPAYTEPEIQRTHLAAVILQMLSLGIGDIHAFPFLDPPEHKAIRDGFNSLLELGAVADDERLTPLGRQLAQFPVDPRISRMLVAAVTEGSLAEVLVIAAALSIQDPRERPQDKQQAADQKHSAYLDEESDFLSLLKLWQVVEQQRQELSQNQFSKWCRKQFLSYVRIREWRDVHRQLLLAAREAGFKLNTAAADYAAIHRALLSGLLTNIGQLDEAREYLGARNRRFHIFPGSGLFKKTPKWLMAAELVETTKLYARLAARIDPAWVEGLAGHLLKREYAEPHWSRQPGQVLATERVSLYGLTVARHQIDFGRIDAPKAREIFIRSALVEAELNTRLPFFRHNQEVIAAVERLEHKSRRRDILVDDELVYAFYDRVLPAHVHSKAALEHWCKRSPDAAAALELDEDYLIRQGQSIDEAQFPDHLSFDGQALALSYHFEPGAANDGVTLELPLGLLNQIPAERLQWLVPGLLEDKCVALVKQLPKPLRKRLVPVPATVARALLELKREGQLTAQLALALQRVTGVAITAADFQTAQLEPFYNMNIRVLDAKSETLAQDRDINALRVRLKGQVRQSLEQVALPAPVAAKSVTSWAFEPLFETVEIEQAGMRLKAFRTLVDTGAAVQPKLVDNLDRARQLALTGLARLYQLETGQQSKYLLKNMPKLKESGLLYATLGSARELQEGLLSLIYRRTFLAEELPADEAAFRAGLVRHQGRLAAIGNETAQLVHEILQAYQAIARMLAQPQAPAWSFIYEDIGLQLQGLLGEGFLAGADWDRLRHYPRYLKAIRIRLDKIPNQLARERQWCDEFAVYRTQLEQLAGHLRDRGLDPREWWVLRWMLEEYRVSLYAQVLGTATPVSPQRLQRQLAKIPQ